MYRTVVNICTASLILKNFTFCPHSCICVFCVDLTTNSDYLFIQNLKPCSIQCSPISDTLLLCRKVHRFRPFVFTGTVTCRWRWVWSNGGMILTGENWSAGRKTLYSVGGRWMNEYGAMVEWYWQGKTEVLGEKHYTVWVVDGWMSVEQWWNDTDRGKLKYWEKNIIQCGW